MGARHEPSFITITKKRAFDENAKILADLQKLQNYQGQIPHTFLPLKGGGQAVGSGTSFPILAPITQLGTQGQTIKINVAGPGAHYQTLALTNPGGPTNVSFTGLIPLKSIIFALDVLISTSNLPVINWPSNLFNIPKALPTALNSRYVLLIEGYRSLTEERYVVLSVTNPINPTPTECGELATKCYVDQLFLINGFTASGSYNTILEQSIVIFDFSFSSVFIGASFIIEVNFDIGSLKSIRETVTVTVSEP